MANSDGAMTISPNQLLAALHWRYATKKFDPTGKISAEIWAAIEESLILTPSSFGLQPWKFLVIQDAPIREQLRAESWGQPQLTDASHVVVLAARTDLDANDIDEWLKCMAAIQNTSPEAVAAYRGVIENSTKAISQEARHVWNSRQVYIALGQLMATAAMLGIDACPMEGINPAGYDQILKLEGSGYATAVVCTLGYRAADDKYAQMPKARFDRSQVIQHIG
jgi:nitroreductase